jgi:hypothetical protein
MGALGPSIAKRVSEVLCLQYFLGPTVALRAMVGKSGSRWGLDSVGGVSFKPFSYWTYAARGTRPCPSLWLGGTSGLPAPP